MAKIKGRIKINNQNIMFFKGIMNKNHITYKENDILVTIDIYENKIVMKREKDDYNAILSLIQNKVTKNKYNIKNIGIVFINIKTLKLIIDNNFISIEYLIIDSNETFNYQIEYELLEE